MRERVQEVIDEIRPMLQADGGDVELVEVSEDGVVRCASPAPAADVPCPR